MKHCELPDDYATPVLPTARPVRQDRGKPRWQAVNFWQRGACERITLLWSSHDLYETRDEALEVAVLHAERSEVVDFEDLMEIAAGRR